MVHPTNKIKKILDFTYDKCIKIDSHKKDDANNKSLHCATIFNGSKILCSEFNNQRSSSFGMLNVSEHAECCAIRTLFKKRAKHFPRILSGKKYNTKNKKCNSDNLSMLVIRINKDKELKNSKCCAICLTIIKAYNIKNIYYSDSFGRIIKEKVKYMISDFYTMGIKNMPFLPNIIYVIMKKNKDSSDEYGSSSASSSPLSFEDSE